jgi:hypothetical protein
MDSAAALRNQVESQLQRAAGVLSVERAELRSTYSDRELRQPPALLRQPRPDLAALPRRR